MKKTVYILFIALFIACKSDDSQNPAKSDGFDRKEMLTFWAEDIIIPGYKDFAAKTTKMDKEVQDFVKTPTEEGLKKARETWKEAYISWQKVSLFQIGKASSLNLVESMNTYPAEVSSILEYADKPKPNFASSNLNKAKGFPTLDYLLNGVKPTDTEIVQYYGAQANVKKYLGKVSAHLNSLAVDVSEDWVTYKTEFIAKDGNSATSSVNKVVNFYVIPFYEKQLRKNKIETPAGIGIDGVGLPTKVEAPYHGKMSKTLYITSLTTAKNFFNGTSYDGTKKGVSLQQYLEKLGRKDLADLINANFSKIEALSSELDDDFAAQVVDTEKRKHMLRIFDAIQKVLKNFKPDMFSALSITITATDGDND